MIVGYVTLGPGGMTLLPRQVTGRAHSRRGLRAGPHGADAELLLSPLLYVPADGEHEWPDPTRRRLVARIEGRRYITSEEVLARARELHGSPRTVSLIPTELIFPGARSDDRGLVEGSAGKSDRSLNRSHRRHRFRGPRNRARHLLFILACVLCAASVTAWLATRRPAHDAYAKLTAARSALASAIDRAGKVSELQQESEALHRKIAGLDQFAFVQPATLVGAIAAALPATVTIQRVSVGGYRFVVDARGSSLLPTARELEALPMVTDVTVQSRSGDNGMVFGQIRGRFGP